MLSEDEKQRFQSVIGKLFYVSGNSRIDLSAAVSLISSYVSAPRQSHVSALKRILRYCKGTLDFGIVLGGTQDTPLLVGYSDADWANCPDSRRSRTGYVFQIGSGCITWNSKKQPTVALSTAEAEYMSLSAATQELKWLSQLLGELGFPQDVVTLKQDNTACINIADSSTSHARTKHIDLRHHFIREAKKQGLLKLEWCSTDIMLADILTKAMPAPRFLKLRGLLNVIPLEVFYTGSKEAVDNTSVCKSTRRISTND